jgi:hypothetical protein
VKRRSFFGILAGAALGVAALAKGKAPTLEPTPVEEPPAAPYQPLDIMATPAPTGLAYGTYSYTVTWASNISATPNFPTTGLAQDVTVTPAKFVRNRIPTRYRVQGAR